MRDLRLIPGKEEAHRLQVKIEVQAEALLRWVGTEVE